MINFICGPVGSGKTQRLIDLANEELENTNGLVVYVDKSTKHRLAVDNRIRFINAKEFDIDSADSLNAFLCGLIAGNYDINRIFLDNLNIIANINDPSGFVATLDKMEKLSEEHGIKFYITINSPDADTFDIKKYME